MTRSLRFRLTLGFTLGWAALLALAGIFVYAALRAVAYDQFDDELVIRAKAVSANVQQVLGRASFNWRSYSAESIMDADPTDGHGEIFRIAQADGKLIARVGPFEDSAFPGGDAGNAAPQPFVLPDGSHARFMRMTFSARLDDDEPTDARPLILTLTYAQRTHDVDTLLRRTVSTVLAVGLLALPLGLFAAVLWIGGCLRPLGPLTRKVESLDEDALDARIDPGRCPTEIRPLIDKLNALLGRVQLKVEREQQFVAEAAHELRNPIAGVRANLSVVGMKLRPSAHRPVVDPADALPPLGQAESSAAHLQAVCERLMQLAGLDAGLVTPEPVPVDLTGLVGDALLDHAAAAAARRVRIEWSLREPCVMHADPTLVHLIVRNLVSNAVAYAAPDGVIRIEMHPRALRLTNPVTGDAAPDPQLAFQPFWRADPSRTLGDGLHLGLGLSIAHRAARRLGGTLACATEPGPPPVFIARFDPSAGHRPTPRLAPA